MTNENSRIALAKLGFTMIDFGYYGIYRHEIFENAEIKFVVAMDKCFYESYVHLKSLKTIGGAIIQVASKANKDDQYLVEELKNEKDHAIFEPNRCVKILVDNYESILNYLHSQIDEKK